MRLCVEIERVVEADEHDLVALGVAADVVGLAVLAAVAEERGLDPAPALKVVLQDATSLDLLLIGREGIGLGCGGVRHCGLLCCRG